MRALAAGAEHGRAEDGGGLAAGVADAVEGEAPAAGGAQTPAQGLGGGPILGVITGRVMGLLAAEVVEVAVEVRVVEPHVEPHGGLAGGPQEALAVVVVSYRAVSKVLAA